MRRVYGYRGNRGIGHILVVGRSSPISSAANIVAENFLDKLIAAVGDLSACTGDNMGVPAGGGASLCS